MGMGANRLAGLLAWVAGAALLPGLAAAGETETFGVAPYPRAIEGERRTSFLLPDAGGGTVRDAIRVYNKSTEKIRLRIYGADAARSEDGSLSVAPFGARAEGLGAAIRVAVTDLTLGPKSERVVDFSVDISDERRGGLGAIVTEQLDERAGGGALDLVTRVALLVNPGSGAPTGPSIERVGMDVPWVLIPRTATFEALVNNPGGNAVTLKLRARVATVTGRSFQLAEQEVRLGPGERRTVRIPWNEVPRWGGLMRTTATISWAGGTLARAAGFQPIFPLWLIGALNAVLLLVVAARGIRSAPRPAAVKARKAQAAEASRRARRAETRKPGSPKRGEQTSERAAAASRASARRAAADPAEAPSPAGGAVPRRPRGDILPARGP
ncbi:MAG: hypothetical protein ACRDJ4_13085 [Actinomycetota bacterium]